MRTRHPSSMSARVCRSAVREFLRKHGFTLVELLVVVGIIGIVAGIATPLYIAQLEKSRINKAILDIQMISVELDTYRVDHYFLPDSLEEAGFGNLLDPWGNPYEYLNFDNVSGTGKMRKDRFMVPINTYYDLYSKGKDGMTATPLTADISQDDVIRANDGEYIGLAADY